ncbi:hypothetical protein E2562_019296 [Oryza meyeriana var. granulata]|uniref:RING-type E3 ubiquitin transferase n=1 Tax=Oryza meyeriana var. granulata TaxID=110450 RepID=A0A6G1FAM0_9ORYZ|nr:hypothetical protein E2562_019296 [Oryza meyeriana var. granulata]
MTCLFSDFLLFFFQRPKVAKQLHAGALYKQANHPLPTLPHTPLALPNLLHLPHWSSASTARGLLDHAVSPILLGPAMARMLLEAASGSVEDSLNSDLVVILAGLLCALICVLGLGLVARCACSRRWARAAAGTASGAAAGNANKGVKKEVLRSLPIVTYVSGNGGDKAADAEAEECAICLVEFEDGQAVRVLPQCDHRFHAACIDTWLRAHSSCPSCRRVLVAAEMPPGEQCGRCGARSGGISALWNWKAPACDAEGPASFLA